ncbi:MAG: hypothetical protein FJ271_29435 [Planctomycetes bacterium]|nr:hypothetical protein [Planctomycetota bacterium]
MEINIAEIKVGNRCRKDLGDLASLAKSIRSLGLLQPIVVDRHMGLIAGQRRLEACKELGHATIEATVIDMDNLQGLKAEHDENVIRKDFTVSEKVAIADVIRSREKELAAQRKRASQAKPGHKVGKAQSEGKFPSRTERGKSADKIAEKVGMSAPTLAKATAVIEAANGDPALDPVVEEMDRTGKVEPAYRKVTEAGKADDKVEIENEIKLVGRGVFLANEAINCLIRIPKNDKLRERGFEIVADWVKSNATLKAIPESPVSAALEQRLDDLRLQMNETNQPCFERAIQSAGWDRRADKRILELLDGVAMQIKALRFYLAKA